MDRGQDVRAFWNSPASLGLTAGTREVIANRLEIEAICAYVRDEMHILDVGCGNGITAIELAKRYSVEPLSCLFISSSVHPALYTQGGD